MTRQRMLLTGCSLLLLFGCKTLYTGEYVPVISADDLIDAGVVNSFAMYEDVMEHKCVPRRNYAADAYNPKLKGVWHWKFWTGLVAVGASAATGGMAIYDSSRAADDTGNLDTEMAVTGAVASLVTGVSVAVMSLSKIDEYRIDELTRHESITKAMNATDDSVKAAILQYKNGEISAEDATAIIDAAVLGLEFACK